LKILQPAFFSHNSLSATGNSSDRCRRHIEKQLQDQKMQVLLNDMKKNSGIWMDEKYFGTAVAPVPNAQRRASNPPSELRKSAKEGDNNNEEQ